MFLIIFICIIVFYFFKDFFNCFYLLKFHLIKTKIMKNKICIKHNNNEHTFHNTYFLRQFHFSGLISFVISWQSHHSNKLFKYLYILNF